MANETIALYKQILSTSYNVYGDLNNINYAISRANSVLGAPRVEIPTLGPAPELRPSETPDLPPEAALTQKPMQMKPPTPTVINTGTQVAQTPNKAAEPKKSVDLDVVGKEIYVPVGMQNRSASMQNTTPKPTPSPLSFKPLQKAEVPVIDYKQLRVAEPTKQKETLEQKQIKVATAEAIAIDTPKVAINMANSAMQPRTAPRPLEPVSVNAITNPISDLLKLVKSKGSVTLSEAADNLHVSKDLVEKWSRILSQSSLIKIKYQMVGDITMEA